MMNVILNIRKQRQIQLKTGKTSSSTLFYTYNLPKMNVYKSSNIKIHTSTVPKSQKEHNTIKIKRVYFTND
jgi:purine-nucleoside phosphorylase